MLPTRSVIKFDKNACVLVNQKGLPIGTRVLGFVTHELRARQMMKVGVFVDLPFALLLRCHLQAAPTCWVLWGTSWGRGRCMLGAVTHDLQTRSINEAGVCAQPCCNLRGCHSCLLPHCASVHTADQPFCCCLHGLAAQALCM